MEITPRLDPLRPRSHVRLLVAAVLIAIAVAALLVTDSTGLLTARAAAADYLKPELRRSVEALKAAVRESPTTEATLFERADVLRPWIDAFSLTGRPMAPNATTSFANINELRDTGRIDEGTRLPTMY